jgi:hypothetical protein
MQFIRSLILLLVLALAAPVTVQAGEYELRITYTPNTREMRDAWVKNLAGLYEFTNRADYMTAKAAYDQFIDKANAFDRGVLGDRKGTEEERYQRFLDRQRECRDAILVLKAALARAK